MCPPRAKSNSRANSKKEKMNYEIKAAVEIILTGKESVREKNTNIGAYKGGALGVELWSFSCKKRILVPMS